MTIHRVNRIAVDGTTVYVTFGRHQLALTKASYGDKITTATISEMGVQDISARSPGTYETDPVKTTMESVRYHAEFAPLLQNDGFGNEKIPIVIGTVHPDLGDES